MVQGSSFLNIYEIPETLFLRSVDQVGYIAHYAGFCPGEEYSKCNKPYKYEYTREFIQVFINLRAMVLSVYQYPVVVSFSFTKSSHSCFPLLFQWVSPGR